MHIYCFFLGKNVGFLSGALSRLNLSSLVFFYFMHMQSNVKIKIINKKLMQHGYYFVVKSYISPLFVEKKNQFIRKYQLHAMIYAYIYFFSNKKFSKIRAFLFLFCCNTLVKKYYMKANIM